MGEPLPHSSIPGPLILAALFLVIVILAITARTLIRMVVRSTARVLGAAIRLVRGAPPDKPVHAGAAPYETLLHLLDLNSLARTELGEVPRSLRALVERKGIIFKYVKANRIAEALDESLTLEAAGANLKSAINFYDTTAEYEINPTVLYEDSEEALIIGTLRDLDMAFFYVMRRMSRNVSRNVVKIIALMTALVIVFPFVLSVETRDRLLYGPTYLVFFVALLAARSAYSISARYNGQYFQYFVQTYFSRLLNQYQSAQTAFSNVLNDRTSSLDDVAREANLWFMNMHWLSARLWLLELYVRNMRFQIGRNWLWTVALLPVFLFVSAMLAYYPLWDAASRIVTLLNNRFSMDISVTSFGIDNSLWTVVPSLALLLVYGVALADLLMKFSHEITPGSWLGYRAMDVRGVIGDNIGQIAREIVDRRRSPYGRSAPP